MRGGTGVGVMAGDCGYPHAPRVDLWNRDEGDAAEAKVCEHEALSFQGTRFAMIQDGEHR